MAPFDNNDGDAKLASCGSISSGIIFATAWYLFIGVLVKARADCVIWSKYLSKDCLAPLNETSFDHSRQLLWDAAALGLDTGSGDPPSLPPSPAPTIPPSMPPVPTPPPPAGMVAPDGLVAGTYWAPMILTSFGLIMLNIVSFEAITEDSGDSVGAVARIWVTLSLIFMFVGFAIAIWCLVEDMRTENGWHWAGGLQLLSNFLLLIAAFLFRLTRRAGEHAI